jgi:FlaA1/EpsC-like NDP-sugar epimerase
VLGTENVSIVAAEVGAQLITLSTDKAVEPVNFYGASKLLAERIVLSRGGSVVRYGNVLGSRGSVVPVFRQQIANGQPLTITDERMTRFILTLDEAIKLVGKAQPDRSAVYVAKPSAVGIMTLALALGGPDYPTVVTGIRPGEKLHECLISPAEHAVEFQDHFEVHPELPAIGWAYTSDIASRIAPDALSGLLAHVPVNDL